MELNEREKNIVDLINNLSEVADDEATTQEAIDRILANIKAKTAENIKAEMDEANKPTPRPTTLFPGGDIAEGMKTAISDERLRMMKELTEELKHGHDNEQTPISQLVFTRIREVKVPTKAHPTDAGIDFFVPDKKAWDEGFRNMVVEYSRNPVPCAPSEGVEFIDDYLEVAPRAHVAIPSGIKTIIP